MSPALARLKRGVRAGIVDCGGVDGAAATADRSRSTAGDWMNLNSEAFPPVDRALALDEAALAQGKEPQIVRAYARELGGIFVPHIDVLADEGSLPWLALQLSRRLGELSGEIAAALANDGVVDAIEAERIMTIQDQHDRVSAQLRQVMQGIIAAGQKES